VPPQGRNKPGPSFYPDFERTICKRFKLQSRSEWNSFGQGYASFVDLWFYKDSVAFRLPLLANKGHHFTGLHVFLSRLGPYFIMCEGSKSWTTRSASSGLPGWAAIDNFVTPEIKMLAAKIDVYLTGEGLVRLHKAGLAEHLPERFAFESNLGDDPMRLFDALFFWQD